MTNYSKCIVSKKQTDFICEVRSVCCVSEVLLALNLLFCAL